MKAFRAAIAALLLLASFQSPAGVGVQSVQIVPSADGTLYSAFPDGDGPTDPGTTCDVPSGWACATVGIGTGTIDKQSDTEWDFDVIGNSATQANVFAYKDAGSGDVQLVARITDSYAGSSANFAGLGIGLREGLVAGDWQMLCFSPQSNVATVRSLYGSDGTYTPNPGAAGQSRPRYIAVTYDVSQGILKCHESGDGVTYTELSSTTRTLADAIAFLTGQSGSSSVSFQATADNISLGSSITVYTPEDPPEENAPTLLSQVENQVLTQGISFSLCVSSNFDGATSYTATGLPSGTGLSFNTSSGCVSGTPDSDDVTASPFNVEFCGVNPFGSTCDTAQFSVTSSSVDVLSISSGTDTVDCDTFESGGKVDPGDILQLPAGNRGPLTIRDCAGTPSNPIILRNDPSDSGQAVIRRTGSGAFAFQLINVSNFIVDGTGKWSGAPSGECGINQSTLAEGRTQCGIKVTKTTTGNPTAYIKVGGSSTDYTLKGIEIDGVSRCASGSGLGVSINDQSVLLADNPGTWRENLKFQNLYIHDSGGCGNSIGSAMYLGPNASHGELPLRNIEVSYSLIETIGGTCVKYKNVLQGTNSFHHNHLYDCGGSGSTPSVGGVQIKNTTNIEMFSNVVVNTLGSCLQLVGEAVQPGVTPATGYVRIFNNLLGKCGTDPDFNGRGVHLANGFMTYNSCQVDFNTIATTQVQGINTAAALGCVARNNIIAGAGGAAVSGATSTNNRTGSVAAQNFANAASDDYHLTSSSPARNSGNSTGCRATDVDDEARPQEGTCDQGGDEYTP